MEANKVVLCSHKYATQEITIPLPKEILSPARYPKPDRTLGRRGRSAINWQKLPLVTEISRHNGGQTGKQDRHLISPFDEKQHVKHAAMYCKLQRKLGQGACHSRNSRKSTRRKLVKGWPGIRESTSPHIRFSSIPLPKQIVAQLNNRYHQYIVLSIRHVRTKS